MAIGQVLINYFKTKLYLSDIITTKINSNLLG